MSDARISELSELDEAPAADDLFVVVDVSDETDAASGTTKRVSAGNVSAQFLPRLTPLRTDSTATVTLDAADLGRTVFCTFDGAVDAEVAADLDAGWWCEVVAANDDTVVTVVGDTGVTVVAAPSSVSEDQWSVLRCLRTPTADQVLVTGRAVES